MLKDILRKKGVKQNWLAHQIGVSQVTLSNWVKDKSNPSKKNLQKLCEVLNVNVKELLCNSIKN